MVLVTIGRRRDEHITEAELSELLGRKSPLEDWVGSVADERAEIDFEAIYKRDLIEKLLAHTNLTQREREAIAIVLEGGNLSDLARKKNRTRGNIAAAFRSAVAKLRETAIRLGELQPSMPSNSNANECCEPLGVQ